MRPHPLTESLDSWRIGPLNLCTQPRPQIGKGHIFGQRIRREESITGTTGVHRLDAYPRAAGSGVCVHRAFGPERDDTMLRVHAHGALPLALVEDEVGVASIVPSVVAALLRHLR